MSFFPKEILEKCYVVFVQSESHTQLNTNIERHVAIVSERVEKDSGLPSLLEPSSSGCIIAIDGLFAISLALRGVIPLPQTKFRGQN